MQGLNIAVPEKICSKNSPKYPGIHWQIKLSSVNISHVPSLHTDGSDVHLPKRLVQFKPEK